MALSAPFDYVRRSRFEKCGNSLALLLDKDPQEYAVEYDQVILLSFLLSQNLKPGRIKGRRREKKERPKKHKP